MNDNKLKVVIGMVLLLTVTTAAMTLDTETSGESTDEWITVDSPDDLERIGTGVLYEGKVWSLSAHYIQTKDIILTGKNNHTPIGNYYPFEGTYDGNGMIIKGMDVYYNDSAGMFKCITFPARILNISLIDAHIESYGTRGSAGGISGSSAGSSNAAVIKGCTVSGTISSENYSAGGVIGSGNNVIISECSNSSLIYGQGAGGIAGVLYYNSIVERCYNVGNVTAYDKNAGGISGFLSASTINDSYNRGSITVNGDGGTIGGIVGLVVTNNNSLDINSSINNSYNTGTVDGKKYNGSIYGNMLFGIPDINNCYYIKDSGNYTTYNGEEKSFSELIEKDTYIGWDFEHVWKIMPGEYPILRIFDIPFIVDSVDKITIEHGTYHEFAILTESNRCLISISGAPWLSISENIIHGTSPVSAGVYELKVTASRPGYNPSTVNIMINVVVTKYTIKITTTEGGYASPAMQKVIHGEDHTVTFVPDDGFYIFDVTSNGVRISDLDAGSYTLLNIRNDHEIHVIFKRIVYEMSTISEGKGDVKIFGSLEHGSDATVTFTPEEGWRTVSIMIDDVLNEDAVSTGCYVFNNLRSSHSVYVEFVQIEYTIYVTHTGNGRVDRQENTVVETPLSN